MTGAEALANFLRAAELVRKERFADALAVELLPSDKSILEKRIAFIKGTVAQKVERAAGGKVADAGSPAQRMAPPVGEAAGSSPAGSVSTSANTTNS